MIEKLINIIIFGLPILASAGFLYYWGKSGMDWVTTEGVVDEKND